MFFNILSALGPIVTFLSILCHNLILVVALTVIPKVSSLKSSTQSETPIEFNLAFVILIIKSPSNHQNISCLKSGVDYS